MEGAADSESWGRAGVEGRQTADNNQYGNRWEWQRRAAAGDESIDAHNNHWSHDVHPPNHHLRERKVSNTFNATLLHHAHPSLLLLHLTPPTVTNAPQRDRSIIDVPSIDDDDVGSGKIAPPPQLLSSSHAHGMMPWIASL